jgi:hypothetical protein
MKMMRNKKMKTFKYNESINSKKIKRIKRWQATKNASIKKSDNYKNKQSRWS